jgi:hypothetical protein
MCLGKYGVECVILKYLEAILKEEFVCATISEGCGVRTYTDKCSSIKRQTETSV